MMARNDTFKQQIVDQLVGFMNSPAARTADVVAEMNVLTAQAYIWNSLTPEEQAVNIAEDTQAAEESKNAVDTSQFKKYSSFAVEETMRRGNKKDPIGKTQILKMLVP